MPTDLPQETLDLLYPALHRLENRGLLAADWKNRNIPPENQQPVTLATSVSPNYLKVMG